MKLTIVIILMAALQGSAKSGSSQTVSLDLKNVSLKEAFRVITAQTGFHFIFTQRQLERTYQVTIKGSEMDLALALNMCFKDQPIQYTLDVESKEIVVSTKNAYNSKIDSTSSPIKITEIRGKILNADGQPLQGVSIYIKGSDLGTTTNEKGEFVLKNISSGSILVFSHIGFQPEEVTIGEKKTLTIRLKQSTLSLDNITVEYSTGYQKINPERATGSFVQVNNDLYNRAVSNDVLTKLDGVTSGVYFNNSGNGLNSNYGQPGISIDPNNKLGITIRGQSTLSNDVSKDPLIVVDNFPYEGDINNLTPEMVESVTVLKDAAAASIWGARAGNGVIVITTKKGQIGQGMKIDFNANTTLGDRPNVYYSHAFLNSSDFINIEDTLFSQGYFNHDLSTPSQPAVSEVVLASDSASSGLISLAEANSRINALRGMDVRRDYEKYIYQKSISQQYGLTMRGGTRDLEYALSAGYDNVKSNLRRNGYQRFVVNSYDTYTPFKNLQVTGRMIFTDMSMQSNNSFGWGSGGLFTGGVYSGALLPYTQLADAQGHPLAVTHNLNPNYIDSVQGLGFQNWQYAPLSELANADNTSNQKDLILQAGAKYSIVNGLNVELQYEDEYQATNGDNYESPETYFVRNLVNKFTNYSASSGLTNNFPLGGILNLSANTLNNSNARALANYNKWLSRKSNIKAFAGAEVRDITTSQYNYNSYGYSSEYGTAVSNLNYGTSYPTSPSGSSRIPAPGAGLATTTNRYISYYSNLGYTYDSRYTVSLTGRRDGANIFGVNTNEKLTPLWSAGLAWNASREKFYDLTFLPYLNLRASYGYNGNVYNGVSLLTAVFYQNSLTGYQQGFVLSPPNPYLTWERVKNINVGVDFSLLKEVLSGTFEFYVKKGEDLIENEPLAPQTGFTSFNGNAAATRTRGIDLTLNSKNINRKFKWYTTFMLSTLNSKVLHYDVPETESSVQSGAVALTGHPISGIYSYKWAGLDPTDGDPQGYLAGKVSKDYEGIMSNFSPDSLVFNGSSVPTWFGSLRNTLSFKGVSFSFNIVYKLGYVFRSPSISPNYADIITNPNSDYTERWQKPGDEKSTYVPSVVYPSNPDRSQFYQYSSVLVQNADNIHLKDVTLSYSFDRSKLKIKPLTHLEVYFYGNNMGLIWKQNKVGMDPDYIVGLPNPRAYSIGIRGNL